jgi:hypothetical protein
MVPCIEVIGTVSDEITALGREKYWIGHFNQQGSERQNTKI